MESNIERIKEEIKKSYKQHAGRQVGGGKCDDCSGRLKKGQTYSIPGNRFWCEACTDKFLNASYVQWPVALKNINSYFGPGLPSHIQAIADGEKAHVKKKPLDPSEVVALVGAGSITFSERQFPVVRDTDAFLTLLGKGREVTVEIALKDYQDVVRRLHQKADGKVPSLGLACTGCWARLSESPSFMLALSGSMDSERVTLHGGKPEYIEAGRAGRCPTCKGTEGLLVHSHGEF